VPDRLGAADLGVAPVRRSVGGRREVATGVPPRHPAALARLVQVGEAAGVALGHQRDHPHAGGQPRQQRPELGDGDRGARPPQGDAVAGRIALALGSMIGHVHEQGVAGAQAAAQLADDLGQARDRGWPYLDAGHRRGLEAGELGQQRLGVRALQEPGVLGLRPAGGEVGRRIGPVARQHGQVVARNPRRAQEGDELVQVGEVRGEVVDPLAPAIDGQHVQLAAGGRRRDREERSEDQRDRAHVHEARSSARRCSSRVSRRATLPFRMAMARALRVPTSTTRRLPRVTAV